MRSVIVSDSKKKELRTIRFLDPNPETQRRAEIILLCAHDISHAKAAEIFGCHRNTITNVVRRYLAEGGDGLRSHPRPGRRSALKPHMQSIEESLDKNPVRSVNEACERIKLITGIARKPTQVRSMLHHFGFKRLVSGAMPCPKKKARQNMLWIRKTS